MSKTVMIVGTYSGRINHLSMLEDALKNVTSSKERAEIKELWFTRLYKARVDSINNPSLVIGDYEKLIVCNFDNLEILTTRLLDK